MAGGGAVVSPAPQVRVSPIKSLVLSRGGLSGWAVLQPLFSQLGHDELLIAVMEQIGSSTQATPGQPCGKCCRHRPWAQGHWKYRCSSLYSVVPLSFSGGWGWVWGPGHCTGISPSFSNKFQTGRADFHSPETALALQSPHPSDTPSPMGPSLPFSLLPRSAALCKIIGARKSDPQKLIKIRAMGRAESYYDGCSGNTCPEAEVLWAFVMFASSQGAVQ